MKKRTSLTFAVVFLFACQGPLEEVLGPESDSQTRADARACQDGNPFACTNVADALLTRDLPGDQGVAIELLTEACGAGATLACVRQAEFLSPSDAETILDDTCTAGDALACQRLGTRLRGSDPIRAYGLFGLACEERLFHACHQQGSMLQTGEGVAADPEAAFALFRELCASGGAEGCRENAREMLDPNSPNADSETAEILAQRACAGGDGEGCWLAAEVAAASAAERGDHETHDADVFRRRACEFGFPEDCEF
ncbi:MAG: TPR repeat protein [Bradymonadia bacterium]|jgi:TPR repeat protein